MCAGGVIAFEMALQLQAEGRSADSIILLDSAAPQAERHAGLAAGRRRTRFLHALREAQSGALPARLARLTVRLAAKVRNLVVYESAAWTKRLLDEARFHLFRLVADRGGRVPWGLRGLTVRTVYKLAEREYAPSARLEAPVILFRATEGTGDDEPFQHLFKDPLLGWGRYVTGRPEVAETPGGHSSMLQEPHVRALAARLSNHIEQTLTVEVV
jgi:thioesterase domain-containing protein